MLRIASLIGRVEVPERLARSLAGIWRIARARRGAAALEFAVALPMMLTIVVGTVDLTDALWTWRRLTVAAQSIAEIGTEMSAQTDGTNTLSANQAWQASTAAFAIFPKWKNSSEVTRYGITLSAVVYAPTVAGCSQSCTYVAKTAWSVAMAPGVSQVRPCGTLAQVADAATTTMTTLPVSLASASSLVVADVSYTFQPMFVNFITGPIQMRRSAYLPPRIGTDAQYVHLTPTGTASTCAGF